MKHRPVNDRTCPPPDCERQDRLGQSNTTRHRSAKLEPTCAALATWFLLAGSGTTAQDPAQHNLIANPGFEDGDGWAVTCRNGAKGRGQRDTSTARTGRAAMKLTKANSIGVVVMSTAKPVRVKPGATYTFRGFSHSDDAPVTSLLLFRIGPKEGNLAYNAIDRSRG